MEVERSTLNEGGTIAGAKVPEDSTKGNGVS